MRKYAVLWLVSVCVAGLAGAGLGTGSANGQSQSPYRNLSVFAEALSHIEGNWVEEVDQDRLVYGAIRGMTRELDPHSAFMDPEQYGILSSDSQGRFGGIGVEIEVQDGWLTVLSTFDGGPADRAGLQPGDRFLVIEGQDARDIPIGDAVRIMRGEPGTRVRVRIRREAQADAIEVVMMREIIRVEAVEARVLPDRTVYIRIRAFQATTTEELRGALDRAVAETESRGGVRGVLLDLRNNPGGLLDEAVSVTDEFLASGVIVSTRGRGGQVLSEARASQGGTRPNWPLMILVNGYSASASEIVAGALADHGRAAIAGTRTFGKGSVQHIVELSDHSALKLTVARYYTPNGRSIQAQGIEPDMLIEQIPEAALEQAQGASFSEASLEGHLDEAGEEPAVAEPGRDVPRDGPSAHSRASSDVAPFTDDYQARMAHQALRAMIRAQQ